MSKMQRQIFFPLIAILVMVLNGNTLFAFAAPSSSQSNLSNFSSSKTIFEDISLKPNQQNQTINFFQQLNLTPEQQDQIVKIHRKYDRQLRKKRNTLYILQQQLSDMMVGTETADLVRSKNNQLVIVRQEIDTLKFESMLATREILTLQQRRKFRDLVLPRLK